MTAGQQIRVIRERLGATMRDVEEQSRRIAEMEGREDYCISSARLTQIENRDTVPSVYKLYSLAAIFRVGFSELLSLFGIELNNIARHQIGAGLAQTHLATLEMTNQERRIPFPVRFNASFSANATTLWSRIVEVWGEIPVSLIQHLDVRHNLYGYIGLDDFTMYPLLRPGSFVQIDQRATRILSASVRSEYERPVYFIELRNGFACGWCELRGKELTLVPHPLSPCVVRRFEIGAEAEIIGRITAVATRLVDFSGAKCDLATVPARSAVKLIC